MNIWEKLNWVCGLWEGEAVLAYILIEAGGEKIWLN